MIGEVAVRQLEFLRNRMDRDAFKVVCDTVREDIMQLSNAISADWTDDHVENAKERLHALKGIFGDIGHEPGMIWCDRVRNDNSPLAILDLKAALQRELDQALTLLDDLANKQPPN